jgi:large subunit ribosomal protein L29
MKPKEVRSKTDAELLEAAERLRREGYHLRVQAATSQLKNPALFGKIRRDVARILTVLGARARAGAKKG